MKERPSILIGNTYCDSNKKILKDWIFKIFEGSFCKDHSIHGRNWAYIGFWVKSGTNYYATILPKEE